MDKHIKWSIFAAVAAFIFMCGSVGYLALHIAAKVPDLTATVNGANTALATINKPKSGMLSMVDDTILQGRLTIDATNKVLIHEQNQLSTLDADIAALSSHTDATLAALTQTAGALTGTANAATTTVQGLQPVESNAAALIANVNTQTTPLFAHVDATLQNVNTLVANPNIPLMLTHVEGMTASGDGILADAKFEADKFAHPPVKKLTFWGGVMAGAEVVHKFEPPIF